MADKELPPLRVSLKGDDSDFQKMLQRVVKDLASVSLKIEDVVKRATQAAASKAAASDAEKQRRIEEIHKKRLAEIDAKNADAKLLREQRLQAAKDLSVKKLAAQDAKNDADRLLRDQKRHNENLVQQQKIATEQAKTDAVQTKTNAKIHQDALTAATRRKQINHQINLDATIAAHKAAAIKLKGLADARRVTRQTYDDARKANADINAKNQKSAATVAAINAKSNAETQKIQAQTAAIQSKGAAQAAAISTKAAAEARATATKAAATAAATTTKAAATAAATAAKSAAQVAAIQQKSADTTKKIAAQTAYINTQAQNAQLVGQQRLNAMQQQAQQSAAKHAQSTIKTQQQIMLTARKAARDEEMHVLRIRQMRWKIANEQEAHNQKMRIQEEIHQKRMRSRYYTTHAPAAKRVATSASSGSGQMGAGFGDGLTSRADIYMHANALRALSQSGKGLLDLRINLQQAEIGIRAFTGNAQASASVMAELRDHAEKTSFTTLGLSEAVRNMMSYGLSAREAVDSAKMLGDVSAGNALRFERLAFAMSQITSMGLLQGNELRQLTEQGFNPLETIAKRTGLSMLELRKMMERGQITSKHVTEALKIETSAGGRFADMQKKMAKSLGGVIAQATELTMNLKSDLLGLLERDMIAAVSTFINYLKQLQAYLATPKGKKFARDMMNIAKYTLLAVASFHIVGFAVASVMWWIQSAVSTVSRLTFIFRLLGIIGSAAISILTSPFALVMAAIAAAIVAVGYFSGAVAGPNSAYSAMLALWDITQWFFNNAVGFFQNFQWNWTVLTLWFQTQWKNILSDMVDGGAAMVSATIDNFVTMFRMIGRLWVVFGTWLFSLYEGLFSGEIYEAMVSGFVKVFTWLEKKWKDLGTFVGKIWENLFDPAALYDVMMEGMGLDQVQQTMAEDIMRTREKGLFAGIEGVVKDELGNFKTGLEDFKPTTNTGPLSLLNFSQTDKSLLPPKAPELPDAAAYKGAGFGDLKGGMGTKLASVAAMSYGSSAYSEKLAEQAARFDFSGKPRQNPLVAGQQQTNTILGKILNALNGKPGVNLQPAAVAGGGTTP